MKIRLGYACTPVSINDTASHTLTYTMYKKLGENANKKLDSVIKKNFSSLENIINYNIRNDISFFRMTSSLIPLFSHENVDFDFFNNYKDDYKRIGDLIINNNLRVDMHPSNYVVLNSLKKDVVDSTIRILNFYKKMYKYMGISSYLVLHVSSCAEGKSKAMQRFIDNFNMLDEDLKKMIIVENDDKIFNIIDVLYICETLKVPMVLDYHHYMVNNNGEKIEDYIERIFNTWSCIPKIHFSSPKNKKNKRSHADYIDIDEFTHFLDKIKFVKIDFDIMIEAKQKDEALFRLIRQLKYKTNYKIKKNDIFL